jgi:hypothetical protein
MQPNFSKKIDFQSISEQNHFFAKTQSPFFKNGHFKNVQFQKLTPFYFCIFIFLRVKLFNFLLDSFTEFISFVLLPL